MVADVDDDDVRGEALDVAIEDVLGVETGVVVDWFVLSLLLLVVVVVLYNIHYNLYINLFYTVYVCIWTFIVTYR